MMNTFKFEIIIFSAEIVSFFTYLFISIYLKLKHDLKLDYKRIKIIGGLFLCVSGTIVFIHLHTTSALISNIIYFINIFTILVIIGEIIKLLKKDLDIFRENLDNELYM